VNETICDFTTLLGRVFSAVERIENTIWFHGTNSYKLYHDAECCETVIIEDVCGDLSDLVGVPILVASEDINSSEHGDGEQQWTFYHLRTIKGTVAIRFHGTGNGYYSIGASLFSVST